MGLLTPYTDTLAKLLRDPQFRDDVQSNASGALAGALRGATAGLLGAPSDLLSMFKYSTLMGGEPTNVPLGSEQLGSIGENIGLLSPRQDTIPYKAGEVLGPIAAMGIPKAANVTRNALAGLLGDLATHQGPAAEFGMIGYHGTPHRFAATENNPIGEFDLSKVGTGQGAQAYGHGLYVAENRSVAASPEYTMPETAYKRLSGSMLPIEEFATDMASTGRNNDDIWKAMVQKYGRSASETAQFQDAYDSAVASKGQVYHVDIPDEHIAKMLDWDKPLNEQAPSVQETLNKFGIDPTGKHANWSGGQAYESEKIVPGDYRDQAAASAALKEAGIPGIKYLDQGSRGAGDGTRNFVLFDPSIAKIIKRE